MSEINLGAYAAKRCPRATHNRYSPTAPAEPPAAPDIQRRAAEGQAFEAETTALIRHLFDQAGRTGDLVVLDQGWAKEATTAAMRRGAAVIVNGRLDDCHHRSGAPDVLVRCGGGYLPVDIKHHQTLSSTGKNPRSSVELSPITDPLARSSHRGASNKGGDWKSDTAQLAHYTRLLQDLGWHPGDDDLVGGIIGTSPVADWVGEGVFITWYDLTAPGRTGLSPLAGYDAAFAECLDAAEAAAAGGEAVRPYRTAECHDCPWADYCRDSVPADDASFAIEAAWPDRAQWAYLYGPAGQLSLEQLAGLDPVALAPGYQAVSPGKPTPAEALKALVRRAQMTLEGRDIEPLRGAWPEIPAADIEADFDIEWDKDNRIYQWGLRVRDGQDDATARDLTVYSFAPLDDAAEEALARRFTTVIEDLKQAAEASDRSLKVFHWCHPERSQTRKFDFVEAALEGIMVDLCRPWLKDNFLTRRTQSIKQVAPIFGFQWAVDDAGGLASQDYVERARQGDQAAIEWCLKYNYSDVEAQAWIRDGLRRMKAAAKARSWRPPFGRVA